MKLGRAVTFTGYLSCVVSSIFLPKTLIWNKITFWLSSLLNFAELVHGVIILNEEYLQKNLSIFNDEQYHKKLERSSIWQKQRSKNKFLSSFLIFVFVKIVTMFKLLVILFIIKLYARNDIYQHFFFYSIYHCLL